MKNLIITLTIFIILPFTLQGQNSKAFALLETIQETYASVPDTTNIKNLYLLMDLSKEEGQDSLYAESLMYLSYYLYNTTDYPAYENIVNLSLEIAKDTTAVTKEMYVSILNNAALLEDIKGNYMKSKMMYLNTLELQKQVSKDTFVLSAIYNNITGSYNLLGDYDNAYQTSLQQLKCAKNSNVEYYQKRPQEQNLDIARAYYLTGNILQSQKKFNDAEEYYDNSISYLLKYTGEKQERKVKRLINSYTFLSETLIELSSLDEVPNYIDKIVDIQNKYPYREYKTFELRGLYQYAIGQYQSAINSHEQALQLAMEERSDNKIFPTIARLQMHLGDCYNEIDSLKLALSNYHSALSFFDSELNDDQSKNPNIELVNANSRCFEILHKKAKSALELYRRGGSIIIQEIAINSYTSLLQLIDKMKASYLKDGSKYFVADLAKEVYDEYLDLLYEMQNMNSSSNIDTEILNLIEKNKSNILFASIEKKYALLSSDLPPKLLQKERDLRTDVAFYTKELKTTLNKNDIKRTKGLEQKLFELNETHAILNNRLKSEFPAYYEISQGNEKEYTAEIVQTQLSNDQLFIEYYESDKYIYTFSISKYKTHFHRQNKDQELMEGIKKYVKYISTLPTSKTVNIESAAIQSELIYKGIIHPVLEAHDNLKDLLLVLDGSMSQLPLGSLLIRNNSDEKYKYLIETHEIAYFYSIKQLFDHDTEPRERNFNVLGLAPIFASENGGTRNDNLSSLKSLPFAQEELNYLRSNFNGSFLSGKLATTDNLIKNMGDYSVIHLATHAGLNSTDPMLNEIHLSDGAITNYDIMNLNVSPDLVVLSACNTAQGGYQEGEGMISLSRGFFEAGVKSLQSTLWEMNDYSSSQIVKGMYGNLKQGKRKSSALRASKLEYIVSAEKIRSHPYFWAGMIQIGNDDPIIEKSNSMLYFVILGLLLLVGIFIFRKYKTRNQLTHK